MEQKLGTVALMLSLLRTRWGVFHGEMVSWKGTFLILHYQQGFPQYLLRGPQEIIFPTTPQELYFHC